MVLGGSSKVPKYWGGINDKEREYKLAVSIRDEQRHTATSPEYTKKNCEKGITGCGVRSSFKLYSTHLVYARTLALSQHTRAQAAL